MASNWRMRLREGRPMLALRAMLLRPGPMLLLVLVSVDLALFALHLAHTVLGLGLYGSWSLAADGGWAEVYQYLKWLWLALLTGVLAWRWREWRWLPLSAGFLFLLDTDAMRTHETAGRAIGSWLEDRGMSVSSLPAVELGGMVYLGIGAAVVLPLALWAWLSASPRIRLAYRQVALMLAVLLLVGVVLDALFSATMSGAVKDIWGDLLEDGGEHLIASLLVWSIARRVAEALPEELAPPTIGTIASVARVPHRVIISAVASDGSVRSATVVAGEDRWPLPAELIEAGVGAGAACTVLLIGIGDRARTASVEARVADDGRTVVVGRAAATGPGASLR